MGLICGLPTLLYFESYKIANLMLGIYWLKLKIMKTKIHSWNKALCMHYRATNSYFQFFLLNRYK